VAPGVIATCTSVATVDRVETTIESDGLALEAHLARPPRAEGGPRRGLVLCHGFPADPKGAATAGESYPELADRLAADAGWAVLTFSFRGTNGSPGDFSLGGWLTDLRRATELLLDAADVDGVWLAGFSAGGALALCAAGEDERVRGVASFAAPADFRRWSDDPESFLEHARHVGAVHTADFPESFPDWARELDEIRPVVLVSKVPPRPVLVVHGSDDDTVSVLDARALVDATDGQAELRIITGAGHRLRHDPRAIAVLLGWLENQH
jgi:uncharacterized protein